MSEKNKVFELIDDNGAKVVLLSKEDVLSWIECQLDDLKPGDTSLSYEIEMKEYTDKEIDELPEYDG